MSFISSLLFSSLLFFSFLFFSFLFFSFLFFSFLFFSFLCFFFFSFCSFLDLVPVAVSGVLLVRGYLLFAACSCFGLLGVVDVVCVVVIVLLFLLLPALLSCFVVVVVVAVVVVVLLVLLVLLTCCCCCCWLLFVVVGCCWLLLVVGCWLLLLVACCCCCCWWWWWLLLLFRNPCKKLGKLWKYLENHGKNTKQNTSENHGKPIENHRKTFWKAGKDGGRSRGTDPEGLRGGGGGYSEISRVSSRDLLLSPLLKQELLQLATLAFVKIGKEIK